MHVLRQLQCETKSVAYERVTPNACPRQSETKSVAYDNVKDQKCPSDTKCLSYDRVRPNAWPVRMCKTKNEAYN